MSEVQSALVLNANFPDHEPRIRDIELGERLGYERPRDIRKLIERLHADEKLNNIAQRATVARREDGLPGKPAIEFWLDERSALKVIAKSETTLADAILTEVIDLFVRYRHGELPTAPDPIHPLFARQKMDWELVWFPKIVRALCALYGHSSLYTCGGPMPGGWFASIERKIYRYVWDSKHVDEAIRRMPNPAHGDNWHQLLTPEARAAFVAELDRIADMAELCLDHADPVARFWERMDELYLNVPAQLGLRGLLLRAPHEAAAN